MSFIRQGGKTARRLRKLGWNLGLAPAAAMNSGVLLPVRHALIPRDIGRSIYFGDYEGREAGIVLEKIERDDVVMEVGAGIGFMSALCALRLGGERVFAYEANPGLMPLIAETHRLNQVAPSVRNVLLGEGAATRTFHIRKDFFLSSSLTQNAADTQPVEVAQVDLNEEIARVRPTFLILDIEGGEIEFLRYARLDGIRKICMEIHPKYVGDVKLNGMFERLFQAGFILDYARINKNVVYLYRNPQAAER